MCFILIKLKQDIGDIVQEYICIF